MLRPIINNLRNRDLVGPLVMISPALLAPGYLHAARTWRLGATFDIPAGVIMLSVGLGGVSLLPILRFGRALVALIYVPCVILVMSLWAFGFRV